MWCKKSNSMRVCIYRFNMLGFFKVSCIPSMSYPFFHIKINSKNWCWYMTHTWGLGYFCISTMFGFWSYPPCGILWHNNNFTNAKKSINFNWYWYSTLVNYQLLIFIFISCIFLPISIF